MTETEAVVADEIVGAARSHFLRYGYSRVSTEEIARSVGRSKKTLYKFFETKEALLGAVFARADAEARREVEVLLAEQAGDALTRLRRVLAAVAVHFASAHRVLIADLHASCPALAEQVRRERRQAAVQLLHPVLADAAAAGLVRAGIRPAQVIGVFLACVEGLAAPEGSAERPAEPDFPALAGLLTDGLRAR
jgi:AcrR family transcriptional regulator